MKIDFVSDVVCPWCAIGLKSLEEALERLHGVVEAELHFQPFELNPHMPPEGQEIVEHLSQKYGLTPEQIAQNQSAIRARGAALGFTFGQRDRTYNTFDAHRLLHWAGLEGGERQHALKTALLEAYHTHGRDLGDVAVLADAAAQVGLDRQRALDILAGDEFEAAVREREAFYLDHGIHAVPSVIINDKHLIQGGQPVELFEQALRQIAAETA